MDDVPALEALDLTHVLYDPASNFGLALALATLSPILLMACYGALTVVTRDFLILNMWVGQLGCEVFNAVLKQIIKAERPTHVHKFGPGYGFPSSHSQFMGYFATFMLLHLHHRHRFVSCGVPALDAMWRLLVRLAVVALASIVCYSRYHLGYHTPEQILGGLVIGILLGAAYYVLTELVPLSKPGSAAGRIRRWLLGSTPLVWLRVMDRWAVWDDGGHEEQYQAWRRRWIGREKMS